ncbi:MAG TPA: FHA domain-containing protein [Polyangiaceae bacterium]
MRHSHGINMGTQWGFASFDEATSHPKTIDAKREFIAHYPTIREARQDTRGLGLLIFAWEHILGPIGVHRLEAVKHRTNAAIVGRHTACNLSVPDKYHEVSLRHVLVLVRAISRDEVRIRVIDLNTEGGFFDESGRTLRAVAAEGSVFLRIGRLTLLLLVTDPDDGPPDDAHDAYDCIPERVFLEEESGLFKRPGFRAGADRTLALGVRHLQGGSRATIVTAQAEPVFSCRALPEHDEAIAGTVRLGHDESPRQPVGLSALRRGIMFGRYERCDLASRDWSDRISRVHFMLIDDHGDTLGVDLASSNGTFRKGERVKVCKLSGDDKVTLAGSIEVGWRRA